MSRGYRINRASAKPLSAGLKFSPIKEAGRPKEESFRNAARLSLPPMNLNAFCDENTMEGIPVIQVIRL